MIVWVGLMIVEGELGAGVTFCGGFVFVLFGRIIVEGDFFGIGVAVEGGVMTTEEGGGVTIDGVGVIVLDGFMVTDGALGVIDGERVGVGVFVFCWLTLIDGLITLGLDGWTTTD